MSRHLKKNVSSVKNQSLSRNVKVGNALADIELYVAGRLYELALTTLSVVAGAELITILILVYS